jgi:hypothetical protein
MWVEITGLGGVPQEQCLGAEALLDRGFAFPAAGNYRDYRCDKNVAQEPHGGSETAARRAGKSLLCPTVFPVFEMQKCPTCRTPDRSLPADRFCSWTRERERGTRTMENTGTMPFSAYDFLSTCTFQPSLN